MAKAKTKASKPKKALVKTAKPAPRAKPGKPKPAKPAQTAAPRAKPVRETAASPAWDPNQAKVVVARLLAKWPALTAAEREAFDSLSDDATRAELGSRTKATGVAGDAARWAAQVDKTLSSYALARQHYAPERFVYFLERLDALRVAIAAQDTAGRSAGSAKSGADTALDTARKARQNLVRAMEKFAGNRKQEKDALGAARQNLGDDAAALTRSIREIVTLADAWLASGSAVLLKAARLDQALIDRTRAATDAFVESGADVSQAGPRRSNDTPTVNLAEGWVLEEMRRVKSDFDDAHEESPVIERLIPGPATRHTFGHKSPKQDAPSPPLPPAPSPPVVSPPPATPPTPTNPAAPSSNAPPEPDETPK